MTSRGHRPTSASEPPPSPNSVKDRLRLRGPSRPPSNDATSRFSGCVVASGLCGGCLPVDLELMDVQAVDLELLDLEVSDHRSPDRKPANGQGAEGTGPTAAAPTTAAPRRAAPSCTAARCWRRARSPGRVRERDLRLFMSAPPCPARTWASAGCQSSVRCTPVGGPVGSRRTNVRLAPRALRPVEDVSPDEMAKRGRGDGRLRHPIHHCPVVRRSCARSRWRSVGEAPCPGRCRSRAETWCYLACWRKAADRSVRRPPVGVDSLERV